MEKVSIYIDGGNFYHLVIKKLGIDEAQFDFEKFAIFLANNRPISTMGKRFYIGTVREESGNVWSKNAMSKQTTLFTQLRKSNWEIKTSKLRKRIEEIKIDDRVVDYEKIKKLGIQKIIFERLREKGIDVKLATDLIVGSVDNQYDTAIVVSSDADLIPAIDWVRHRKKKKIEYVGFSIADEGNPKNYTNPLISLIAKTDIKRILVKSDLEQFVILMKMGFTNNLISKVLSGEKNKTYRYGKKYSQLKIGHKFIFLNSETNKDIAIGEVVNKEAVKFSDLPIKEKGHEEYKSKEEQIAIFKTFYGKEIGNDEDMIVLEFKLLRVL